MTIAKTINWADGNQAISLFFKVYEVTKNDPERIPDGQVIISNVLMLARELDKIRLEWGRPIGVTSWYRPKAVNQRVGGARNSAHLLGYAADIFAVNHSIIDFQKFVDDGWHGALGYGASKGFVHIDMRNYKGWRTGGERGVRFGY